MQFLPINLCVLNIISYRITGEEFNFKIIYQKKLLSSEENNNKYNTLITMLEVLEMQRKKILSIKNGKINIL